MKIDDPECVKLKRRGAEAWHRKLSKMTPEQRHEYYRQRSREFREWLDELRRAQDACVLKS